MPCSRGPRLSDGEKRLFTRLQAAYAAMLDHADQHIARLMAFLETAGQLDDTLIIVMSDNGASQEGGPLGMVNAMGPYNLRREPIEEKIARIDDIGGPDTHSNFPLGWAMAANTPLRRYKQNTHGGGIRDPLVMSWPKGIAARGELRHQFCHASDLAPTLLEVVGVKPPKTINGIRQMPIEGTSFASEPRERQGAVEGQAAVFRDVRPSRPGAGRLEGRVRSIRRARPSSRTSGSSSISTATSTRPTISPSASPSG